MKVTQNSMSPSAAMEKTSAQEKAKNIRASGSKGDTAALGSAEVQISDRAQMMRKASELAGLTPDYRSEKVAALKEKIRTGQYQVDVAGIADRLVDEHLATDFGKNGL